MKTLLRLVLLLPLLALVGLLGLAWSSRTAPASGPLEGSAGGLRPCPDSPNCVGSLAAGDAHVAPLAFEGDPEAALERLVAWLLERPRTRLLARDGRYAHLEVSTALLGFRDDLELWLDPEARVVHVRSASRVGYSDLGANRARVEEIRKAWPARP